jgi:hypothetical protein
MAVVTNEPIQLSYFVQDITTAVATFSRLRWWRSRTGQYGVYEAATSPALWAATLLGTMQEPHQLNGKVFNFKVGGTTTVAVTFAAVDPVSTATAAMEINNATGAVIATDEGGYLRLTTVDSGSNSSIEILDGDAAPFLGFVVGDGAVGGDVDTTLVAGTHEYFYIDNNSADDFWYRVEFFNPSTGDTTGTGVPFPANSATHISKSKTIVCYVRLADMSGLPIEGRKVTFANPFLPDTVIDQNSRWGIFRHYAQMSTDRNGYAEIRLLRGINVDVVIEGTNFVRRIQIPTTGSEVDLLNPTLAVQDEFGIQEPQINFAIRLS